MSGRKRKSTSRKNPAIEPKLRERRKQVAYERLLKSPDQIEKQDACKRMASLTALRSPAEVADLERQKGLRDD